MDSPIVKSTLQAGLLSGISNILAQLITCYQSNKPYSISPIDVAHFVLFSLLSCPPNCVWQSWLEAQFPGYTDKLSPQEKEKLVDETVAGYTSSTDEKQGANGSVTNRSSARSDSDAKGKAMTTSSTSAAKSSKKLNLRNTAIKFSLDQTLGAAANTVLFIAGIALIRGHSLESIQQDVQEQFWPMIFAGQKLWPLVSVLSFTVIPVEHRMVFGSIVGLFWGVYLSLVSGERK